MTTVFKTEDNHGTKISPYIIGVTGGIGTGKSTLVKVLEKSGGAQIIDTDKLGKVHAIYNNVVLVLTFLC